MPPGFNAAREADKLHDALTGWGGDDERMVFDVLWTGRTDMVRAIERSYDQRYRPSLRRKIRSDLGGEDRKKALRLLSKGDLSLKEKLDEGMTGWGTDEDGIFNALDRASREEIAEVGNDRRLMARLKDELSKVEFAIVTAYVSGVGVAAARIHRAVRGLGTDEAEIWRVMQEIAVNDVERSVIRENPALMAHIRSDLSSRLWMRFQKMLAGQLTNVDWIEIACEGWGTDEQRFFTSLQQLTADEYGQLKPKLDAIVAMMKSELSGRDEGRAMALLEDRRMTFDADYRAQRLQQMGAVDAEGGVDPGASVLAADAGGEMSALGKLIVACRGWGTKEADIFQTIAALKPAERKFLREKNPGDIMGVLEADLSRSEYEKVRRALGDGPQAATEIVRWSVDGWGTDEAAIYKAIDRIVDEGASQAVLDDWSIRWRLRDDLSPGMYAVFVEALQAREFSPLLRLRWATDRAGTDEELLWSLCQQHRESWWKNGEVVPEVEAVLQSELNTRDYWQALDHIRPEPTTNEERLARSKELLERERGGWVSDGIMDTFSSSGVHADDAWREYRGQYNRAIGDGAISGEEQQLLDRDEAFSERMISEYRAAKGAVAAWASTIAVVIVGVAATLLTGGLAGPFVAAIGGKVAVAAYAMVAAAALKVGIKRAVEGEGYDVTSVDALLDGVRSAVEVGLAVVGGHLAGKALEAASKTQVGVRVSTAMDRAMGRAGQFLYRNGVEEGVMGAVEGAGQSVMDGVQSGAANPGSFAMGMMSGIGGGMLGSAGLAGIGRAFRPRVKPGTTDVPDVGATMRHAEAEAASPQVDGSPQIDADGPASARASDGGAAPASARQVADRGADGSFEESQLTPVLRDLEGNREIAGDVERLAKLRSRAEVGDAEAGDALDAWRSADPDGFERTNALVLDNLPAGVGRTERPVFNTGRHYEENWLNYGNRDRYVSLFELEAQLRRQQEELVRVAAAMGVTPDEALQRLTSRMRQLQQTAVQQRRTQMQRLHNVVYRDATWVDRMWNMNPDQRYARRNLTPEQDDRIAMLQNRTRYVEGMRVDRADGGGDVALNHRGENGSEYLRVNDTQLRHADRGIFYDGPATTPDQAYPTSPVAFYQRYMDGGEVPDLATATRQQRTMAGIEPSPGSSQAWGVDGVDFHEVTGTPVRYAATGPDGTVRHVEVYQSEGTFEGYDGVYEWVVEDGRVVAKTFEWGGTAGGGPRVDSAAYREAGLSGWRFERTAGAAGAVSVTDQVRIGDGIQEASSADLQRLLADESAAASFAEARGTSVRRVRRDAAIVLSRRQMPDLEAGRRFTPEQMAFQAGLLGHQVEEFEQVFRLDTRTPDQVLEHGGFQPRAGHAKGEMTLWEHTAQGSTGGGNLVSTSKIEGNPQTILNTDFGGERISGPDDATVAAWLSSNPDMPSPEPVRHRVFEYRMRNVDGVELKQAAYDAEAEVVTSGVDPDQIAEYREIIVEQRFYRSTPDEDGDHWGMVEGFKDGHVVASEWKPMPRRMADDMAQAGTAEQLSDVRGHLVEPDIRGRTAQPTSQGVVPLTSGKTIPADQYVRIEAMPGGSPVQRVEILGEDGARLGDVKGDKVGDATFPMVPTDPGYAVRIHTEDGGVVDWNTADRTPAGFREYLHPNRQVRNMGLSGGHTRDAWDEALAVYGDQITETAADRLSFEIPGEGPVEISIIQYSIQDKAIKNPKSVFEGQGTTMLDRFQDHMAPYVEDALAAAPDGNIVDIEIPVRATSGGSASVPVRVARDVTEGSETYGRITSWWVRRDAATRAELARREAP